METWYMTDFLEHKHSDMTPVEHSHTNMTATSTTTTAGNQELAPGHFFVGFKTQHVSYPSVFVG